MKRDASVLSVIVAVAWQDSCGRNASSYGKKAWRRTSANGGTGSTLSCYRCICALFHCALSPSSIRSTPTATDLTRCRGRVGQRTIQPSCPRASSPSPTCSALLASYSCFRRIRSSVRCRSPSAACSSTSASSFSSSSSSLRRSLADSTSSITTTRHRRLSSAIRQPRLPPLWSATTWRRSVLMPALAWLTNRTSRMPSIRKSFFISCRTYISDHCINCRR